MRRALEVSLGETRVGWLEQLDDYHSQFSFDQGYLADPLRPILGALFEDRRPQDIVVGTVPPCWFNHLLPQGPLRRLLAKRAGIEPDDSMELLRVCGADLPGAVEISSAPSRLTSPTQQDLDLSATADDALQLSYSLAGNQWKLSVRYGERGLVVPVWGRGGEWIAKFHDPEYARLPQLEHATTLLAARCGLTVPEVQLVNIDRFEQLPDGVPTGDGTIFLTKRFDRQGEQRVHMEDFAQILDRPHLLHGNYAELAAVLSYLCPEDVDRFLLQLVFCTMIGNGDAHLKNWSVQYLKGRKPRLSPSYDLIPTVAVMREKGLALALGPRTGQAFDTLTLSSFDDIASACSRPVETIRAQVHQYAARVYEVWQSGAEGYDDRERARIDKHLQACWQRLDTGLR